MPFLLLLLLTVACLPVKWPRPPDWVCSFGQLFIAETGADTTDKGSLYGSIILTWSGIAFLIATAALISEWVRRQLARHPELRERYLRRHAAWRFYHLLGLLVVYGVALYVLGWGWVVHVEIPGTELIVLAPFLIGLVLSWACFYDAERALHNAALPWEKASPYWNRRAYLSFHVRHNLALVFVPLLLLVIVNGLPKVFPQLAYPNAFFSATTLAVVLMLACMPWMVRLVLSLKPMPEGPLRSRLLAASRRLRFRCSNILLWNTRGGIANAMVVGVLPIPRYVVLTDRLVADMSPDEVEAVFGHEVGHVKHHHMLYYLGFLMGSLVLLVGIGEQVAKQWLGSDLALQEHIAALPLVGLTGTYIFVVFGFLSRRCERQADVFGCRTVSCANEACTGHTTDEALSPKGRGLCPTGIHTFINALEKVAYLNGISRDRPGWLQSWQHSTIARRVEFLQRLLVDPSLERRFQRRVLLVKLALILLLGALGGVAMLFIGK